MTPTNLKLQHRRLEQLKAIGAKLGMTSAEAVAYMIRKEIAAGTIPASLPGINIERVNDGVKIGIDNFEPRTLSLAGANAFVTAIRDVLSKVETGKINMDHDFSVVRQGTGIHISVPIAPGHGSYSPDLASDFADLVEKAAA